MSRMSRFVATGLVICVVLLFAACSTMGATSKVSEGLQVPSGMPSGEIFGSIVRPTDKQAAGPTYMRYDLRFRRIGTQEGGFVAMTDTIFDTREGWDLRRPDVIGKSFRQALPPGDYEIYNFDMSSDTGQVSMRFWSEQPFSVKFHVSAGEAVYLGRFIAVGVWGKGLFGLRRPDGGYFRLANAMNEDLAAASAKGTPIAQDTVRVADLAIQDHARLFLHPEH